MDITSVVAFAVAALLLSLAPGPDIVFIVGNAIAGGRRAGLLAALGTSSGIAVHTVAAALGLGALLRAAPGVLDATRLVGALVLGYLAVSAWRASREPGPGPDPGRGRELGRGREPGRRVFWMAMLTNLANPKVILFYLAFLPQFLTRGPESWAPTAQLLTFGALLIVIGFAVDASAGLLAGTFSERLFARAGFRRWLERVSAAIFGGLAVRLLSEGR